jgi:hypothetical protein
MDEQIDESRQDAKSDPRVTDRDKRDDEIADEELERVSGGHGHGPRHNTQ